MANGDDLPPELKRELAAFNPAAAASDGLPPLSSDSKDRWMEAFGTQREIAEHLGVSQQRVSQLMRRENRKS